MTKLPPVGSMLRHKKTGQTRTVEGHYKNVSGGFWLDKPVAGFRSWNIDSGEFKLISKP